MGIDERVFITSPFMSPRYDACAALQVRVETRLQHVLNFNLQSLAELHTALVEGDFSKILACEALALIVVPRLKRGLLLGIVEEGVDGDLLRMVEVNARAREQLVRGCNLARAAAADPALFGEAVEAARIAQEMVIV
ncbi:MAG: hypothetical protein U0270_07700 [Labilithrix sp.]